MRKIIDGQSAVDIRGRRGGGERMKKGIVLLCLVALLVAAATAAMADDKWLLNIRAGAWSGSGSMSGVTTATIGADVAVLTAAAAAPGSTRNDIASFVGNNFYNGQRQLLGPDLFTFNMVVARGSSMSSSVYITAWSRDVAGIPQTTGWFLPEGYEVNFYEGLEAVAANKLATWTAAELNVASAPASTAVGPVGFFYNSKGDSASYADSPDVFTVTVGVVPEPGSLLALGSGLIGFAGFAMRRRRA